jgi:hypothetical protein
LGSRLRQGGLQGCGPRGSPGVILHAPGSAREWGGVNPHTPKGVQLWELESRWILESSGGDFKGQNSMARAVLYTIGKILERRCLKWARIAHLDIWKISYGQKKGRESNCQFDSRPLKVGNRPDLLVGRGVRHIVGKLSMRATTLLQTAFQSEVCSQSYGAPKSRKSQLIRRFQDSHLGVPGQKVHLDVASVERRRVYYKGEGGGFPQVGAVLSLVCPGCPWLVLALKVLQLCTNHFVLVLCRFVWVSKACHFFLVPSRSSSTPLYRSIVLWARERAPTACSSDVFSLGLPFESLKELEVRQEWNTKVVYMTYHIGILLLPTSLV